MMFRDDNAIICRVKGSRMSFVVMDKERDRGSSSQLLVETPRTCFCILTVLRLTEIFQGKTETREKKVVIFLIKTLNDHFDT